MERISRRTPVRRPQFVIRLPALEPNLTRPFQAKRAYCFRFSNSLRATVRSSSNSFFSRSIQESTSWAELQLQLRMSACSESGIAYPKGRLLQTTYASGCESRNIKSNLFQYMAAILALIDRSVHIVLTCKNAQVERPARVGKFPVAAVRTIPL